ncbi:MAG: Mrp/NBP35 family ATP-binding protein [Alphaproteobacteria bacterium]
MATMQIIPHVRYVLAVSSGKGGVGKSTTAVNIAAALSTHLNVRVGVLDADIYGPSLPRLTNTLGQRPDGDDTHFVPILAHGLKLMSMGYLTEDDTSPIVWRGPLAQRALLQMATTTLWGTADKPLDVLVVDLPPGTGDVQLTIAQHINVTGAVVITTPQDVALADARKGLEAFRKMDLPILGIVENMSGFVCPHCQTLTPIFGAEGGANMAEATGVPLLAEIPLDMTIREKTDSGTPVVLAAPDSAAAAAYRQLAEKVWTALQAVPPRTVAAPVKSGKVVIE